MKKRLVFLILLAGLTASAAHAEPTNVSDQDEAISGSDSLQPKRLRDSLYSVSSDELDKSESLNRVAGHIDLGFSNPSQSFNSSDHYSPGPFGREKAELS